MELTVPVYDDSMAHVDDLITVVENIPQWAIQFVNREYSSDMHLENAFRHEMMISDSMFPEFWMNIS